MAREQQRKTTRVEVKDAQLSPPRIEEHTRYINARGGRNGVRAAEALQDAFKVGQKIAEDQMRQKNTEGVNRAIAARAAGTERDVDDENFGYNKAWDQLDAEYDYNLMEKELPEILRGMDAENQPEADVQATITQYFEDNLKGIDLEGDDEYAKFLAPRLVELETKLIAEHRDAVIGQVREDQRTKIFANAQADFVKNGTLDYQKLFDQTGTFFEGSDKKVVMWETIYDTAIEAGRPDLIEDVPDTINGIPSGINDPALQDQHRAAVSAAHSVAARKLAAKEAEQKANYEQQVKDTQLLMVEKYINGENVDDLVESLRVNPEAKFSDVTAAINFAQTEITYDEDISPQRDAQAALWGEIHRGNVSITDVLEAHNNGLNGFGKQAHTELRAQLSAVVAAEKAKAAASQGESIGPQITAYRGQVTAAYNPQMQGALGPLDHTVNVLRNEAVSEYDRLVYDQGMPPREAMLQVREQFDAAYDRLKPDALSAAGSRSQSTNASAMGLTVSVADARRFANGEMELEAFAGTRSVDELILQIQNIADDLSQEELEAIAERFQN